MDKIFIAATFDTYFKMEYTEGKDCIEVVSYNSEGTKTGEGTVNASRFDDIRLHILEGFMAVNKEVAAYALISEEEFNTVVDGKLDMDNIRI